MESNKKLLRSFADTQHTSLQRYGSDGMLYPFYDFDHPGASAVYCSAHDLVRFGMFHLKQHLADQKAILSDETLDEMQVSTVRHDEHEGYGIGWGTYDGIEGYHLVTHDGGMGGVRAVLWLVPAAEVVVVVLTNTSRNTPLLYRVGEDVLALLMPTYAEKRAQQQAEWQRQHD